MYGSQLAVKRQSRHGSMRLLDEIVYRSHRSVMELA
jgi:hypothetical protein